VRERLIQEDYLESPWKMSVVCILLNQTTNQQVRKVLDDLFILIKSPEHCPNVHPDKIYQIIRSTGFGNVKAKRIIEMSKAWISGFDEVEDLPGIGKYGKESWEIFVNGKRNFTPTDKKLKAYLEGFNDLN
jgi:endonuclease III